jgi:hypothetical protein
MIDKPNESVTRRAPWKSAFYPSLDDSQTEVFEGPDGELERPKADNQDHGYVCQTDQTRINRWASAFIDLDLFVQALVKPTTKDGKMQRPGSPPSPGA